MQELEKILEEIDEIKVGFDTECRSECDLYDWSCGACVGECDEYIKERAKDILRKHMNDGWIPVEERSPAGYERIGYDKIGNKYMRRLEIAYMTDTIEYVHGYYDGYKWMDKWYDIIENVVAWKIHEPYRPERSEK